LQNKFCIHLSYGTVYCVGIWDRMSCDVGFEKYYAKVECHAFTNIYNEAQGSDVY